MDFLQRICKCKDDIKTMKDQSLLIQNKKETEDWLLSVKAILGYRKYNEMKDQFFNRRLDVGFIPEMVNTNSPWMNNMIDIKNRAPLCLLSLAGIVSSVAFTLDDL